MDHADRGRVQHEIGELIDSRAGIESERITERKVRYRDVHTRAKKLCKEVGFNWNLYIA